MAVPNSSISELLSVTIQDITGDINDSVSNMVAFLAGLKEYDGIKKIDGGPTIQVTHEYQENQTFGWYNGADPLNISPTDVFTGSQAAWKQCSLSVPFIGRELLVNSGRSKKFDLVESRIMNAKHTYANQLNTALYSDGTGSGGKILTGLTALVPVTPTTGTVQGLDRSLTVNAWFRSQVLKAVTDGYGSISSSNIQRLFNRAFQLSGRYKGKPSLVIASDGPYTAFEESLQALVRLTDPNNKMAKMGFQALMHKNTPVVYEPTTSGITTDYTYVLDLTGLQLVVHKDCNFVPLNPTRYSINQDMEVRLMASMLNLVLMNARKQVLITNT